MSKNMLQTLIQILPYQSALFIGAPIAAAQRGVLSFELGTAGSAAHTLAPFTAVFDGISVPKRRRCST